MGYRKSLPVFLILFTIIAFSNLFAQTKTFVTTGLSWWSAQYDIVNKDGDKVWDVGNTNMFGPYISVSHNKFNFGASLFWGSVSIKDLEGVDLKRADLNLTAGYRLLNTSAFNMNLFLGMKYLNLGLTGKQTTYEWDPFYQTYYPVETDMDVTNSGALFGGGISTIIPFGTSRLYAYGSLAALAGTLTYKNNVSTLSQTNDASTSIVSLTAGLGYRFPSGLGINGGYRGDFFGSEDSDLVDRLQGFNLTLSYTFQ